MACVNKDSANFVELAIPICPTDPLGGWFQKVLSFDWHPNYTNKVALLLSSSTHQGTTKSIQIIKYFVEGGDTSLGDM
uniref:Uncharacterized protein n=1 Tax=Ditylenchus dipsaci TaxID=166011 RepID=A0A915EE32_9BILA